MIERFEVVTRHRYGVDRECVRDTLTGMLAVFVTDGHAYTSAAFLNEDVTACESFDWTSELPECSHPRGSVTWKYKGPGKTVTVIDGLIHGTCDDCGKDVYLPASFDEPQGSGVDDA